MTKDLIREIDAAIDRYESNYGWLLYGENTGEISQKVFDEEKLHIQTILTALKFFKAMLEPSGELLEELQDYDFSQKTAQRILPETVQAYLKEAQGE
jgi:hypothetical protein